MEEAKLVFDTVRPLDRFAQEVFADLSHEPLIEEAADQVYISAGFDPRNYLKTAKVLRCTPSFWMWLGKVKDLDTLDVSGDE